MPRGRGTAGARVGPRRQGGGHMVYLEWWSLEFRLKEVWLYITFYKTLVAWNLLKKTITTDICKLFLFPDWICKAFCIFRVFFLPYPIFSTSKKMSNRKIMEALFRRLYQTLLVFDKKSLAFQTLYTFDVVIIRIFPRINFNGNIPIENFFARCFGFCIDYIKKIFMERLWKRNVRVYRVWWNLLFWIFKRCKAFHLVITLDFPMIVSDSVLAILKIFPMERLWQSDVRG